MAIFNSYVELPEGNATQVGCFKFQRPTFEDFKQQNTEVNE